MGIGKSLEWLELGPWSIQQALSRSLLTRHLLFQPYHNGPSLIRDLNLSRESARPTEITRAIAPRELVTCIIYGNLKKEGGGGDISNRKIDETIHLHQGEGHYYSYSSGSSNDGYQYHISNDMSWLWSSNFGWNEMSKQTWKLPHMATFGSSPTNSVALVEESQRFECCIWKHLVPFHSKKQSSQKLTINEIMWVDLTGCNVNSVKPRSRWSGGEVNPWFHRVIVRCSRAG